MILIAAYDLNKLFVARKKKKFVFMMNGMFQHTKY